MVTAFLEDFDFSSDRPQGIFKHKQWIKLRSFPSIFSKLRVLRTFIIIVLTSRIPLASALADGDDFSNNLFSDLGPILALFGEQVAKQFMAGSLGWSDNIIFAMVSSSEVLSIHEA